MAAECRRGVMCSLSSSEYGWWKNSHMFWDLMCFFMLFPWKIYLQKCSHSCHLYIRCFHRNAEIPNQLQRASIHLYVFLEGFDWHSYACWCCVDPDYFHEKRLSKMCSHSYYHYASSLPTDASHSCEDVARDSS